MLNSYYNRLTIEQMMNKNSSRSMKSRQNLQEKSTRNLQEAVWIGQDIANQTPPDTPQQQFKKQKIEHRNSIETKPQLIKEQPQIIGMSLGTKSPVQLMQDILRMVGEGEENRVYYSKESEEALGELLTNRFKLNNYLKKLENEMVGLDSSVVKNYEMLVLLLDQMSGSDVEVRQGQMGMEIRFNRGVIERQEAEIQRLEREKQEREKQIKYIIQEYQSIIFNFNDVIQKLVNKDQGRLKPKY